MCTFIGPLITMQKHFEEFQGEIRRKGVENCKRRSVKRKFLEKCREDDKLERAW